MMPQPLPWCDPLMLAQTLNEKDMVLLHSSAKTSYSGRYSLLAVGLEEAIEIQNFDMLDQLPCHYDNPFNRGWFGYLGYELKHDCETYSPATAPASIALPKSRMMRFGTVYQFDHCARTLAAWSEKPAPPVTCNAHPSIYPPKVSLLESNMTKADYLEKVAVIQHEINQGNLYQANLTRKFMGKWQSEPDSLALFTRMCKQTPAPYSAYIRIGGTAILSSSPELFLRLDASGRVETRPIKGTSPRGNNEVEDAVLRDELATSTKNRAENLMIVDLMRNDLARICKPGSIAISELYDVNTHATIHHMASSISGALRPDTTRSHLLRACFPPGSMTGAPKIRAVELCNALEGMERGIYSGAIGWLGGDGSLELSVVIRTLIMQGTRFEFQVGGGIIADSTPEEEWQETIDKSKGILKTLDLERQRIERI